MQWIKQKYDRCLLLIAALLLLLSSGALFITVGHFLVQFTTPTSANPSSPEAKELSAIERAKEHLLSPAIWKRQRTSLFTSRPYIEKEGELIDPTSPESRPLHPPVPNIWLYEHLLPLKEQGVLDQDPDDDGFENRVEWKNKTDPTKADSHPDYAAKLSLTNIIRNPFYLLFSAQTSEGIFQIDAPDSGMETQFLQLGDRIKGSDFILVDYREQFVKASQIKEGRKDISELTIEDQKKGQKITLTLGQQKDTGDKTAVLLYLWKGEKEYQLKQDETFELSPAKEVKYKIVDIEDGQVVVEKLTDKTRLEIPLQKPK